MEDRCIVPINKKMIDIALDLEKQTLKNIKSTPNYSGFTPEKRYFIGYLGEMIFLKYCQANKLHCVYNATPNGESGGSDFMVYDKYSSNEVFIDIKTASKKTHKKIMIPKIQFDLHKNSDYYVAIRLISDKEAEVHGYCNRNDFILNKVGFNNDKIPTMYVDFHNLKSIKTLSQNFKNGNIIHNLK